MQGTTCQADARLAVRAGSVMNDLQDTRGKCDEEHRKNSGK